METRSNNVRRRVATVVMGLLGASLATLAAAPALGEPASGVPGAPRAAASRIDVRGHSCFIDGAGVLSCWGDESGGELGNGGPLAEQHDQPTPVDTAGAIPDTWTAVTVGSTGSCALATDATAWCWGRDSSGELGNGAALTGSQASPTPADTAGTIPDTWTAIAGGDFHTCAIATDGTAWCWGADPSGELGNGAALTGNQVSPSPVDTTGPIPDTWTAITAGDDYACAIGSDGTAWCWGNDSSGQLGNGAVLTANQPSPTPVDTAGPIPDTWTAITAGSNTTCAIATDATAWCWGNDNSGALGNGAGLTGPQASPSPVDTAGPIPDTWTAISAGPGHICAIGSDGTAWCWGSDFRSRLGNGPVLTDDQPSPSPVDTAGSIPDTWVAIGAGSITACAIASGGTVWCWGSDLGGRLGNGTVLTAEQPSPSCAVGCGITTQASAGGPVGTAVSDTATVTGTFPTGTVTFNLFGDSACLVNVFTSPDRPLSGGTATSATYLTTAPGTYYWTAVYSGDGLNPPASSPCGAPNESVTLTKATPSISTVASPGGPLSTAVRDVATLGGGFNPTGSVTFRLFSDAGCNTQVFSSTNTVTAGSATSAPDFTPTAAGTYWWTAVYNGDANNTPVTSPCGAPNESVTITKATPSISTQASPGGLVGTPVRDVATVSGGFNPTGTVTFRLFSDPGCATQVFTSTNPLGTPSDWFTPASAGTYRWIATYNGDANNTVVSGACNDPNESVTLAPFVAPAYTRIIQGDLMGPVTVTAGESVLIDVNARVVGPVTVQPGGALTVTTARIHKGIVADSPGFLSICGSEVAGPPPAQALGVSNAAVPVRIGDPATGCAANRFAGTVTLTANLAVTFGANSVSHATTVTNGGPGNTVIKANTFFATLACSGNTPAPTNAGQPNTAPSKTGQCAGI